MSRYPAERHRYHLGSRRIHRIADRLICGRLALPPTAAKYYITAARRRRPLPPPPPPPSSSPLTRPQLVAAHYSHQSQTVLRRRCRDLFRLRAAHPQQCVPLRGGRRACDIATPGPVYGKTSTKIKLPDASRTDRRRRVHIITMTTIATIPRTVSNAASDVVTYAGRRHVGLNYSDRHTYPL